MCFEIYASLFQRKPHISTICSRNRISLLDNVARANVLLLLDIVIDDGQTPPSFSILPSTTTSIKCYLARFFCENLGQGFRVNLKSEKQKPPSYSEGFHQIDVPTGMRQRHARTWRSINERFEFSRLNHIKAVSTSSVFWVQAPFVPYTYHMGIWLHTSDACPWLLLSQVRMVVHIILTQVEEQVIKQYLVYLTWTGTIVGRGLWRACAKTLKSLCSIRSLLAAYDLKLLIWFAPRIEQNG